MTQDEYPSWLCRCCGDPTRRTVATLYRRGVRQDRHGGWLASPEDRGRQLCMACLDWVRELTFQPGARRPLQRPIGAPSGGAPVPTTLWRCQICRADLPTRAVRLDCHLIATGVPSTSWLPIAICRYCDRWLTTLLSDAASARTNGTRALDGSYGAYLHPQLSGVSAQIEITHAGTRATVISVGRDMGVLLQSAGAGIALREVVEPAQRPPDGTGPRAQAEILFVQPQHTHLLSGGLGSATVDWLTIPVTPQQVSAALLRASRPHAAARWEPSSHLPILDSTAVSSAYLVADPVPPADPAEVAWLIKRFARGYDVAGVVAGRIALLPRSEAGNLHRVAARLQAALGDLCTVRLAAAGATSVRIDVSG